MKNYPAIKYALFFIAGIIIEFFFQLSFLIWMILVAVIVTTVIISSLFKIKYVNRFVFLIIIATGGLYSSARNIQTVEYPFTKTKITQSIIYGIVEDISLPQDQKILLVVRSDSINLKGDKDITNVTMRCNIKEKNKSSLEKKYEQLGIGQKIKIKGTINKARGKRNPGEFDYYKYLTSKGISATLYAGSVKNLRIVDSSTEIFANSIFKTRKYISEKIEEIYNKNSRALIKGLLLADRSEIDYRVKESFINSGVIHVLAVSGLHVGFIVIIFLFLFSRTNIYLRIFLTILGKEMEFY